MVMAGMTREPAFTLHFRIGAFNFTVVADHKNVLVVQVSLAAAAAAAPAAGWGRAGGIRVGHPALPCPILPPAFAPCPAF